MCLGCVPPPEEVHDPIRLLLSNQDDADSKIEKSRKELGLSRLRECINRKLQFDLGHRRKYPPSQLEYEADKKAEAARFDESGNFTYS